MLSLITNAPLYILDHIFYSDLRMKTIAQVVKDYYTRYHSSMKENFPNSLVKDHAYPPLKNYYKNVKTFALHNYM